MLDYLGENIRIELCSGLDVLGSKDHSSIWYPNKYYLEGRKVEVVIGKEAAITQINWNKGMFDHLVCVHKQ